MFTDNSCISVQLYSNRLWWDYEYLHCSMEFHSKNLLNVHFRHCKEKYDYVIVILQSFFIILAIINRCVKISKLWILINLIGRQRNSWGLIEKSSLTKAFCFSTVTQNSLTLKLKSSLFVFHFGTETLAFFLNMLMVVVGRWRTRAQIATLTVVGRPTRWSLLFWYLLWLSDWQPRYQRNEQN